LLPAAERRVRRPWVAALLFVMTPSASGAEGEVEVTGRRAVALVRALAYDSSLGDRAGDAVVLAVLFKKKNARSEKSAQIVGEAFKQLESLRVVGHPFRRLVVPFSGAADLEDLVQREGVDALFLCEALDGDLAAIKQVTHRKKVLTTGSTEAQVRAGVALAAVAEGLQLPLYVNWRESRDEGASFGSDLLRLARVIR
jgi:hypothetical protein